jgi:methionyl-tRNA formyltransferase
MNALIAAGETEHGASIHFVTAELDGGPVIVQARVPVLPGDDSDALAARVLEQEHRLYPQAIRWFAEGRLKAGRGAGAGLTAKPLDGAVAAGGLCPGQPIDNSTQLNSSASGNSSGANTPSRTCSRV